MSGYLLDTHVWLWVQQGDIENLSSDFLHEIDVRQPIRELYISAISILEVARLVELTQHSLGMSIDRFVDDAFDDDGFVLADLSPRILIESTRLPGDLHRDPADRILAATCRVSRLTLITRDKRLLDYAKQGHLKARKS